MSHCSVVKSLELCSELTLYLLPLFLPCAISYLKFVQIVLKLAPWIKKNETGDFPDVCCQSLLFKLPWHTEHAPLLHNCLPHTLGRLKSKQRTYKGLLLNKKERSHSQRGRKCHWCWYTLYSKLASSASSMWQDYVTLDVNVITWCEKSLEELTAAVWVEGSAQVTSLGICL